MRKEYAKGIFAAIWTAGCILLYETFCAQRYPWIIVPLALTAAAETIWIDFLYRRKRRKTSGGEETDVCRQYEQSVYGMKLLNSYISHEIKNSLNILSAMVELDEEKEGVLAAIRKMSEDMEDILILSEVSSEWQEEEVDLALICAETVDEYRRICPDIAFELPELGVSTVRGRQNLYKRAVANLLENAIRHGGKSKIIIKMSEYQQWVSLCVQDQGAGISEQNIERVLGPNRQITRLNGDGHGVGLNLVRTVAERAGGAVWAENRPEGGAAFYFVVRAAK